MINDKHNELHRLKPEFVEKENIGNDKKVQEGWIKEIEKLYYEDGPVVNTIDIASTGDLFDDN